MKKEIILSKLLQQKMMEFFSTTAIPRIIKENRCKKKRY